MKIDLEMIPTYTIRAPKTDIEKRRRKKTQKRDTYTPISVSIHHRARKKETKDRDTERRPTKETQNRDIYSHQRPKKKPSTLPQHCSSACDTPNKKYIHDNATWNETYVHHESPKMKPSIFFRICSSACSMSPCACAPACAAAAER